MAITNEQFDRLVRKLETYAQTYPDRYALKLRLLAYLGYAYIITVLLVLIALITITVVITLKHPYLIKFVFVLGVFIYLILKSLNVKFDKPDGIVLDRADVPAFFKLCDSISEAAHAPRIKQVLITNEFNASVYQFPRLGILGGHENYLTIGLPLMSSLTQPEFKAVLAHEFAHLSHAHGKFGNWIYRIRRTWNQMMDSFQDSWIFKHFFNWYAPYFWAYSFVYARTNEYEADRTASTISGSRNMAAALIRLDVYGTYLGQKYWPGIYEHADDQQEPYKFAFTEILSGMKRFDVSVEEQQKWLDSALRVETGSEDTHPSLTDRLKALKTAAKLPEKIDVSAAESLLGTYLPKLQNELDTQWAQNVENSWKTRYEYAQEAKTGMSAYEAKLEKQEAVTTDETYRYAAWVEEFRTESDALPLYEKVLAEKPEHVSALVSAGNILLKKDDERGAELIEKAMKLDNDYVFEGTKTLYYFFINRGEKERAQKYYDQAQGRSEVVSKAEYERSDLFDTDEYMRHGLDKDALDKLKQELKKYPYIEKAYMVRKKVEHLPEKPFYVMGVTIKLSPQEKKAEKKNITMKEQIGMALVGVSEQEKILTNKRSEIAQNMEFPGEALIFVTNTASRKAMVIKRNKTKIKRKYGLLIGDIGAALYPLRYGWFFVQAPDDIAQPEHLIYTRR